MDNMDIQTFYLKVKRLEKDFPYIEFSSQKYFLQV